MAFNGGAPRLPRSDKRNSLAYPIAPFDACGGHVNLHEAYHCHAVTDCLNKRPKPGLSGYGTLVGIAMDGYLIPSLNSSDGTRSRGLDACNGPVQQHGSYHYQVGAPGSNAIPLCHGGESRWVLRKMDETCDASKKGPRPQEVETQGRAS